jgi:hypothetical protein
MSERKSAEAMSQAALRRLTVTQLAARPRLAYTALLLAGVIASGAVLSLLVSEPSLPLRTRLAFGVLAAMGLAWAGFAAWVLTRRRVLFAWQRVIAARMAVACSSAFAAGVLAAAVWTPMQARALRALWVALPMLALSIFQLVRAHRRHRALVRRREDLEGRSR